MRHRWGHGMSYWRSQGGAPRGNEAVANLTGMMGSGDMAVEVLQKTVPETTRAWLDYLSRVP